MPHWIFGSFNSLLPPLLWAHSRSLGAPCFQGLFKAQLQTHNILLSPLPQLQAAVCPTTPPRIHTTELSTITMEMSLAEVRRWLWKPVSTYSSLQTFQPLRERAVALSIPDYWTYARLRGEIILCLSCQYFGIHLNTGVGGWVLGKSIGLTFATTYECLNMDLLRQPFHYMHIQK